MLGVHRLGRAFVVGLGDRLVVEDVAPVLHRALLARRSDDDDGVQVVEVGDVLVDGLLDGRGLALATGAVDGDQRGCLAHRQPFGDGGRSEATEHDGVWRADACAREHRHDDLGDHRHEDPDDVALLHTAGQQHVGQSLYIGEEVGVGQRPLLAALAVPVECDLVAAAVLDVPIQAVVRGVELSVSEPGEERRPAVIHPRLERGVPAQPGPGLLGPPRRRVRGLLVDLRVGDAGRLHELGRRVEPLLLEQIRDALFYIG